MELEDEQHQLVHFLNNEGWNSVVKPELTRKVKALYEKLLDPKIVRKEELPDDFIRGQIAAFRYVVEWPVKRAQTLDLRKKDKEREEGLSNV